MVNRIPVVNWFKDDPQDPRLIANSAKIVAPIISLLSNFAVTRNAGSDELVDVD